MPRVVFVTVGLSAVDNKEIAEKSDALREQMGEDDARVLFNRLEDRPEQVDAIEALFLESHRDFWNERDGYRETREHFRQTSAEMISTYMAIVSGSLGSGSFLQPGRDKVVLLLSDTVPGRVCGNINRVLFREFLFRPKSPQEQDIVLETIKGLDASGEDPERFYIYPQVTEIIDRHAKDSESEVLFNIGGGYKGTIPAITHIAWTRYADRAKILYMHDSSKATVTLTPEQGGTAMRENRILFRRTGGYV